MAYLKLHFQLVTRENPMNYTKLWFKIVTGDTAYHFTQYHLHDAACQFDRRKILLCSEELVFFPTHVSYKHYYISLSGFLSMFNLQL